MKTKLGENERNQKRGKEGAEKKMKKRGEDQAFSLLLMAKTSGCMDLILPYAPTFPRETDLSL